MLPCIPWQKGRLKIYIAWYPYITIPVEIFLCTCKGVELQFGRCHFLTAAQQLPQKLAPEAKAHSRALGNADLGVTIQRANHQNQPSSFPCVWGGEM